MSITNEQAFNEYIQDYKNSGASDKEIAMLMAGMKLAFATAIRISERDSRFRVYLDCMDIAFKWQKHYDPQGITWNKEGST